MADSPSSPAADAELGQRLVDAVHAAAGAHPGYRVLHAHGVGATGAFTSTGDGARITTAAHLQPGVTSPARVRFSNGTSDPDQTDGTRDGRGFAVKLTLPDASSADLVGLTLPVFFVRTPEDFLAFMAARIPDPETGGPDLNKIMAFLGEHPEAQRAVELSMGAPMPASYTTVPYFGIHAFWFTDADGTRRKVRYRWEPDAGVATITDEDAGSQPARYLADELAERLAAGPASFTLVLSIGTEDDDETDPTTAWPDDRETITAGHLELTAVPEDQEAIDHLIFDPTRVPAGIECAADQILHARSAAYGVSYSLRTTA